MENNSTPTVYGETFNKNSVWEMSLNDDTFNDMKMDFDKTLSRTLSEMENRGSESAEITVSLKITLRRANVEMAFDETRDAVSPKFEHKVASVLKTKFEYSGSLYGNFELIWDKDMQKWVMTEIRDGQMSFFD